MRDFGLSAIAIRWRLAELRAVRTICEGQNPYPSWTQRTRRPHGQASLSCEKKLPTALKRSMHKWRSPL